VSYRESWKEEKQSAFLYRIIAEKEKGSLRETLFLGLAREAERQAEIWTRKMNESSMPVPASYTPGLRVRLVATLVRRWGPKALRTPLTAMKIRGLSVFDAAPPAIRCPPAWMRSASATRAPSPAAIFAQPSSGSTTA
jgi:hypothetical protein